MTEMWEFCENENSGRINNKYRKLAVWGGPAVRFTPRKAFRNIAKNDESKKSVQIYPWFP